LSFIIFCNLQTKINNNFSKKLKNAEKDFPKNEKPFFFNLLLPFQSRGGLIYL